MHKITQSGQSVVPLTPATPSRRLRLAVGASLQGGDSVSSVAFVKPISPASADTSTPQSHHSSETQSEASLSPRPESVTTPRSVAASPLPSPSPKHVEVQVRLINAAIAMTSTEAQAQADAKAKAEADAKAEAEAEEKAKLAAKAKAQADQTRAFVLANQGHFRPFQFFPNQATLSYLNVIATTLVHPAAKALPAQRPPRKELVKHRKPGVIS